MTEALLYLGSSFWLGAVHAITPGHGKTIAAAYIVGARGKPMDAVILGIFVTLSHTSGIVLVGVLASLGLPGMVPHRIEAWMALVTGVLVILIGLWTLWTQRGPFRRRRAGHPPRANRTNALRKSTRTLAAHARTRARTSHGHDQSITTITTITMPSIRPGYHSHGWGFKHTHNVDLVTTKRPGLWVLIGLGVAGGLLPDPAALAILLSALAQGKVMLGLGTVLVFSVGFAATLVLVGVVAAVVGQRILAWLAGPSAARLQIVTSLVIVAMGVWLTWKGWATLVALR